MKPVAFVVSILLVGGLTSVAVDVDGVVAFGVVGAGTNAVSAVFLGVLAAFPIGFVVGAFLVDAVGSSI